MSPRRFRHLEIPIVMDEVRGKSYDKNGGSKGCTLITAEENVQGKMEKKDLNKA